MYQNGFVVAVKINGKTVEEKDNGIIIPFNSEYSLMLKNRNDRKAVARIYIDGKEVTEKGRLIIEANSSINVERFIDNTEVGKKFKFVKLSDNRVSDKGDSEKGFIEVRFQLVKPVLNNFIVHEEHVYKTVPHFLENLPYIKPIYVDFPIGTVTFGNSNLGNANMFPTLTSSVNTASFGNFSCDTSAPTVYKSSEARIEDNKLIEEKGATIKGSNSSQKFCYSYVGELESTETVMRFQISGSSDDKLKNEYIKLHCTNCGKAFSTSDNFCSSCGKSRKN